jgi:nucleoid DNA-binding protein
LTKQEFVNEIARRADLSSRERRAERQGVNPRNPTQKVTIPAATVPKFTAGSQLKAAVKSGGAGA